MSDCVRVLSSITQPSWAVRVPQANLVARFDLFHQAELAGLDAERLGPFRRLREAAGSQFGKVQRSINIRIRHSGEKRSGYKDEPDCGSRSFGASSTI